MIITTKKEVLVRTSFFVGLPGLEPGKTGPESVVLPLHHSPNFHQSAAPIFDAAKIRRFLYTTNFFSLFSFVRTHFLLTNAETPSDSLRIFPRVRDDYRRMQGNKFFHTIRRSRFGNLFLHATFAGRASGKQYRRQHKNCRRY